MSGRPTEAPRGALSAAVRVHDGDAGARNAAWGIAEEVAVEVTVDGAPWTVCMATPAHLEELAVGLAITEGRVADVAAVAGAEVTAFAGDYRVALRLVAGADSGTHGRADRRTVSPTGACGLCGLESLAALQARVPARAGSRPLAAAESATAALDATMLDAVRRAFDALPGAQPLNAATRSVHAAAWCTPDGALALVREDVGRHNALDKLVGALALAGRLQEPGFVIMTSRCSYELVAKCAHTGARLLATWSAPTGMALRWARAVRLPLLAVSRARDGVALVSFLPDPVDEAG
ncbi:MAG: formate dehydrogenase accessory sulfurtransferase FdhD [Gemmatimonadetes bacterium]|nr:formate dehydrogenase accessory sulfurtransferase FdhD [Gemmatimonadota bacterium]